VRREPALIPQARARAQLGEGVPQALHARRQTRRDVLAQRERQPARLRDLSRAEGIARAECERKRQEGTQPHPGVTQLLRPRDAQAPPPVHVAA
jgi:hypothetical protein